MATPTAQNRAQRRAKAKKARPGAGADITIKVDGEAFTLHTADLTPHDTIAVRKATGMSLRQVLANAKDDPDIDVLAVLVTLARRHAGEPEVSFEDVFAELGYGNDYDVDEADDEPGEGDSPEA